MTDTSATDASSGGGVDVASLLRQGYENVKAGLAAVQGQAGGLFGSASAATGEKQKGIQEESGAQQELVGIEAAHQAEINKANIETMGMAGALPGAQSKIMQYLSRTVGDKLDKFGALQNEVEESKGIGPLDDPVKWLINSFTEPYKQAKLEQMQTDINENLGIAKATQEATSQAMANNAAAIVPDLAAKAAATNRQLAAVAVQKAADAKLELDRLGISAAQLTLATTTASFDAIAKFHSADVEDHRLLLDELRTNESVRLRKIEEAKLGLETQLKTLQFGEYNKKIEAETSFNTTLNAVMGPLGITTIKNHYDYTQLSPQAQKAVDDLMINYNAQGGSVGRSPAEVLQKMEAFGSVGGTPGMALTTSKLNNWKASAAVDPSTGQPNFIYNSAKPEVKRAIEDAVIETHAKTEAVNIPSEGGLYSPPPLGTTLRGGVVSKLPLAKQVEALAKNPQYGTKPDDLVNAGIDMMKAGKATPADIASQVSTIFKQVADTLNQSKNYRFFTLPELGSTYNMTLTDPRGRTQVLNLLNEAQLRSYLTRRATEQQMYDAGPGGIP